MGKNRGATWAMGTIVLSLLLAAAAWFLLLTPVQDSTELLESQTSTTSQQNSMLEVQLAQLKSDAEHLDEYRGQLATLRKQITTEAELPPYFDQLAQIAAANSVTVLTLSAATPQSVVPVTIQDGGTDPTATAEPVPEPSPTATESAENPLADDSETAPPPTPEGPAVPDGFVAIPVRMTVLGSYDNVGNFLQAVQQGTERLFLVTNLAVRAQDQEAGSGGRPPTEQGDIEMDIDGFVYVVPDATTTTEPAAPTGDASQPAPDVAGGNPFRNLS